MVVDVAVSMHAPINVSLSRIRSAYGVHVLYQGKLKLLTHKTPSLEDIINYKDTTSELIASSHSPLLPFRPIEDPL